MKSSSLYQAQLSTPFCVLGIRCEDDVLTGIDFLALHGAEQTPRDDFASKVCAQLQAYFGDAEFQFDLPLKLSGTEHQLKVWQAMRDIPLGQVLTYGEIAAQLKSSPRAVGQACGNNPIPIVVPCHRVVSKTGLGGFMHRADDGGLDIKRCLLKHEGALGISCDKS
ncbi:MAG: methylated-DNA--[protein]-cysteine S-methyltransferase [Gallionellaceae bacterium]